MRNLKNKLHKNLWLKIRDQSFKKIAKPITGHCFDKLHKHVFDEIYEKMLWPLLNYMQE